MTRRKLTGSIAVMSALTVVAGLTGCSRSVDGTAMKEGAGTSDQHSADQYPNLLKECDVLTNDVLAKTVGADPLDIQSTFVGAVCRWQALNQTSGLIDITRFWYERGNLDEETQVAKHLNYKIENKSIAGVKSIIMHGNDPNGSCGVASDAAGVVGWWVNPQGPGADACGMASKLMDLTLATNS
ncbi:hypothetical protein BOO86_20715 [Mycobacterium sp. CBMA 234]|uniref:DUF3558 domain-containing protein n=1 Tax=Mycolicibacterium sp. CBMA 234 TaxID=1918495 RepID=UPI0012DE83D0|nr:DUF3558 domain-containing protein [Mycolicibacterium sp. CBMA 234]MUL66910.1 hypothetical protein [Mycolicibacterium sp. CBMA 234]